MKTVWEMIGGIATAAFVATVWLGSIGIVLLGFPGVVLVAIILAIANILKGKGK